MPFLRNTPSFRRAAPSTRLLAAAGLALGLVLATGQPALAQVPVPTPRVASGDLLITNHSFEDGLTGWTATNGRGGPASRHCQQQASVGPAGATDLTRAAQFAGTSPCAIAGLVSAPLPASPGVAYTAFADAAGPGQLALGLRFLDAGGRVVQATQSQRMDAAERLSFTATAPAGATRVAVEIGATRALSVDDVRITEPFTKLGPQVTRRGTFLAMAAGYDQNGRAVTFTVATGNAAQPAVLVVTDLLTNKVTRTVDLPGATGSWTLEQAPDGTVYVGTYQAGRLYAWKPGDAAARVIGTPPIPGFSFFYALNSTPEGRIYGGGWGEPTGGYAGAQLWTYHPSTGMKAFGPVLTRDAYYTRAVAYDDASNTVWAGTGTVTHLYGCAAETEKCTDFTGLLGDTIRPRQWVYGMTGGGGYIQIWGGEGNSLGNDALVILKVGRDAAGAVTAERVAEIPGVIYNGSSTVVDGKVYYTKVNTSPGIPLHSYDLATGVETRIDAAPGGIFSRQWEIIDLRDPAWPGPSVVGWNSGGIQVAWNIATGRFSKVTVEDIPLMSTGLNSLVAGPDGRIWSAGYLTGGLGVVTPMRDDRQSTATLGGQAEGMLTYRGRVYQGIYPYGQIQSFTPAEIAAGQKPRIDCTIGEKQNRPYALLGHGDRVYFGSQADYGHDLGAFGWLDLNTGKCTTISAEIGHYSVNSLTQSHGRIFGATNVFYAWDGLPLEREAYLLVHDTATDTRQRVELPVDGLRAVDALTTDARGTVWAYAGGWLLALDPVSLRWTHVEHIFPDLPHGERIGGNYAELVAHPDGRVYGNVGGRLFTFDPSGDRSGGHVADLRVLLQGKHLGLTIDEYGNLWTTRDQAGLLRVDPRGALR